MRVSEAHLLPAAAQSNVKRALPAMRGVGCLECTNASAKIRQLQPERYLAPQYPAFLPVLAGARALAGDDENKPQALVLRPAQKRQKYGVGFALVLAMQVDPRIDQIDATVPFDCSCTYFVLAGGDHALWGLDEHAILTRIDPGRNVVDRNWGGSLPYEAGLGYGLIAYGRGSVWTATGDSTAPSPNSALFQVDPDVPRVHNNVPLAAIPYGLAFAFGSVWVSSGNRLLRYEPTSMTLSASIPLGASALGIGAGDGSIWVAGGRAGIVTRVDPSDNRVIARIPVGHTTGEVAVDARGAWVNVTN